MIHYGAEPPWRVRSRYGRWERGADLWDGTIVWHYVDPPYGGTTVAAVAEVLRGVYLDATRDMLRTRYGA